METTKTRRRKSAMSRLTAADKAYQTVIYVVIILIALMCVFPMLYVVLLSMTSEAEWIQRGNSMLVPYRPTLRGYIKVFNQSKTYMHSLGISGLRTAIGTGLTLTFSMYFGYVLSRREMPGNKLFMFLILITVLFHGGTIPTYLTVKSLGLVNTFWAMIVPGLVDSWGVLVFRQFFMNLPHEIEESAYIDGISEIGLMIRIIAPMSLPVVAAMGLFIAVGHWNAWFDALIYIQDDMLKPLQLIIHNMSLNADLTDYTMNKTNIDTLSQQANVSTRSLRMCLTVMGTVPILIVYPFLQKYFVKGVYVGAVKG